MKTYAQIRSGLVAELLKTDGDITSMFNPELIWVDVSTQQHITEGWHFDGTSFTAPAAATPPAPAPTIAELQAQIAALGAQIAALSAKR